MANEDKEDIPQAWLEKANKQEQRLKNLSSEDRNKWGFTENTAKKQAESDEQKNPSKK